MSTNLNCLKCPLCQLVFIAVNSMRNHIATQHLQYQARNGRDDVLQETLDNLVLLAADKANDAKKSTCQLCKNLDRYVTSLEREEHVFNSHKDTVKRGFGRGRKIDDKDSKQFWKSYSKCFPEFLLTDIQKEENTQQNADAEVKVNSPRKRKQSFNNDDSMEESLPTKRTQLIPGKYSEMLKGHFSSDRLIAEFNPKVIVYNCDSLLPSYGYKLPLKHVDLDQSVEVADRFQSFDNQDEKDYVYMESDEDEESLEDKSIRSSPRRRSRKSKSPLKTASSVCWLCKDDKLIDVSLLFQHVVEKHCDKMLWQCSHCQFGSQSCRTVRAHLSNCKSAIVEGQRRRVVDKLGDYLTEFNTLFANCFRKEFKSAMINPLGIGEPAHRFGKMPEFFAPKVRRILENRQASCTKCAQCGGRIITREMINHIKGHMSKKGNDVFQCQIKDCKHGGPTKYLIRKHLRVKHCCVEENYVDNSSLDTIKEAFNVEMRRCFGEVIICAVCYNPFPAKRGASEHVWGHVFEIDKLSCRFECTECTENNRFNLELMVQNHLINIHQTHKINTELEWSKKQRIVDRTKNFESNYLTQWKLCFPTIRPDRSCFNLAENQKQNINESGNSSNDQQDPSPKANQRHVVSSNQQPSLIYCKFCSVGTSKAGAEDHVYWHIARMFSVYRYKCSHCSTEDWDGPALLERCTQNHSNSKTFIVDQVTAANSRLPKIFEGCAAKCFYCPPKSIYAHLPAHNPTQTASRLRAIVKMAKTGEIRRIFISTNLPTIYSVSSTRFRPIQSEEWNILHCSKCRTLVASNQLLQHSECHLIKSGDWKRYNCGACNFASCTKKAVEGHYEENHFQGFCQIRENDKPTSVEIESMHRECFDKAEVRALLNQMVKKLDARPNA